MEAKGRQHSEETPILLFDGVCILCSRLVQFIISRDTKGSIRFAALQSEAGHSLMKKLGLSPGQMDTLVLVTGDSYLVRSTAILHIFKALGGFWRILYLFILVPASWRDRVYTLIAQKRYRLFGKRESCMIPDPEIRSRFLE